MTGIEKAARAIYEGRNGAGAQAWGSLRSVHRKPYIVDAKSAILAIREPNEAMLAQPVELYATPDMEWYRVGPNRKVMWQAMIDILLNEKPK